MESEDTPLRLSPTSLESVKLQFEKLETELRTFLQCEVDFSKGREEVETAELKAAEAEVKYWQSFRTYSFFKEVCDLVEKRWNEQTCMIAAFERKAQETKASIFALETKSAHGDRDLLDTRAEVEALQDKRQLLQDELEHVRQHREGEDMLAEDAQTRAAVVAELLQKEGEESESVHTSYSALQTRLAELQKHCASLRSRTVSAYERNETIGQKIAQLTAEKSTIQSNLSAIEQLFDLRPDFKVPRPVVPPRPVMMSQAVEPLKDICVVCGGPLFGKTCVCTLCNQPMHWHCVTNGERLCMSCFGS